MLINSLLDTDLYKLTQCASILKRFPQALARFKFINRANTPFPAGFSERLKSEFEDLSKVRLTIAEYNWLLKNCDYLTTEFLSYIMTYRFKPEELSISNSDGKLECFFSGKYSSVMQWEVPAMAIISQLYFDMLGIKPDERAIDRMIVKANFIYKHGLHVADFGTRRRFSFDIHDQLVGVMKDIAGPNFLGTSNLKLAMKYDVKPIGTQAHEMYMLYAAIYGVNNANSKMIEHWEQDYNGKFLTALTDTYTSDIFFKQMTAQQARFWQGLRQDSGDPLVYLEKAIAFYEIHGINPKNKRIVFSDSLDVNKALQIRDAAKGRIECVFGIGTNLTNDVGAQPLNIVIKLDAVQKSGSADIYNTVKLSDTPGKSTGDPKTVVEYKSILNIK